MIKIYMVETTESHKKYIGLTSQTIERRLKEHKYGRNTKNQIICRAIKKYGVDTFSIRKLDSTETMEDALKLEREYVKQYDTYNNGYNGNEGGYGPLINPMLGKKHTDEAKRKMSEKRKGKQPRLGTTHSEETKKKISDANLGKQAWNKGIPCTEKAKRKQSETKKGKVSWTKTYEVTFPDGHVEIIYNMAQFCRKQGLQKSNMSSVAKGRLKQYRKFICKEL